MNKREFKAKYKSTCVCGQIGSPAHKLYCQQWKDWIKEIKNDHDNIQAWINKIGLDKTAEKLSMSSETLLKLGFRDHLRRQKQTPRKGEIGSKKSKRTRNLYSKSPRLLKNLCRVARLPFHFPPSSLFLPWKKSWRSSGG